MLIETVADCMNIFGTKGFPARWDCGTAWQAEPWWGWLSVVSDLAIWGAYTAIPLVLIWFLRRRAQLPFERIFWLFSLFILACGATHLMDAAVFWWPAYRLAGMLKLVTAIVSCATVAALIPIMPAALALKSPDELEAEIVRRTSEQEDLLRRLNAETLAHTGAASSLVASETRLRFALQAGRMGTWDWNLDTNQIALDPIEQELTGLVDSGNGIPLEAFMRRVHPDDEPALRGVLESVIETGKDYRHEFRYQHPDGSLRWLAGRGRVLPGTAGSRGRFLGINFDISERRRTEEELTLRTRAIESATNAITIIDLGQPDHPFVYANSAFCQSSGYAYEEVIGCNLSLLQGPDTDPQAMKQIVDAIAIRVECAATILNYRKDGTTFWNDLRLSPVVSSAGEATHFICVQSDVTERVTSEQDLQRARQLAESASDAKTQFLANMSHEIRTPLTAILGCADTLYRQMQEEESLELVKMVRDQGELLLGILNDVLDVSKIEAGKLEVRFVDCPLLPIIADIQSLMQPQANEQGLQLSTIYATPVPMTIRTDPLRLRQILLNLTSNAIKFTKAGQVQIRVRCQTEADQAALNIDVIDTGIGIGADQLEAIFQPFSQISQAVSEPTKGTGLGLTICRSLIGLLGGRLSVRSIPGEGSRFTIRLPLGSADELELRPADEITASAGDEQQQKESLAVLLPCRVLVAEDTRGLQFMLKRMLQDFVASVAVVSNGEEAIDAVQSAEQERRPFDIILMDMQMPVMNGFDATSRLRGSGFDKPIIALTAGAMGGDREKCLASGCSDYLTKPIDRAQLLMTLINAFDAP